MKKKSFIIALMVAGSAAMAQDLKSDKVPSAVKDSFKKLYPNISNAKWEMDEGNYEAEFKNGKEEWEVEFDAKGNLIKSELELSSLTQLPKAVQDALKKDYAMFKAEESEQVTLANGKKVFEVEMKMDGKKYELQFEETGVLISKTEDLEKK
jgi:uncharacterized membrane protein YkoI